MRAASRASRPGLFFPRLALLALLLAGCNRVYYQPSRGVHGDAAKAGYRYSEHYFLSGSGNSLHGRFFPRREGTTPKGLWIFFHGNARNISGSYSLYAWVTAEGWDYFVFDYSGYGQSKGEAGRVAAFEDGLAALRMAARNFPREPGGKLVLAGESLGGAILLGSLAEWDDRALASLVFVDGAFPSYRKVARAVMADRFYAWPFQFLGPLLVGDAHAPERGLARLAGIPLLVAHCREDEEVPFRMGEALHAAAPGPKWFWPLEGCGHTQGFSERFPENRRRLMAFVDSVPAREEPQEGSLDGSQSGE